MADDENDDPSAHALALLKEALSVLDRNSQHIAAAFVARAMELLDTKQPAQ